MSTHAPAPATPMPTTVEPRNGLAIASLVLGLIGVFLGLFAGLTWLAVIPLGILAVTFGIIGIARKRKGVASAGKMAGFGTALGVLSLALGIWGVVIFAQAVQQVDKAVQDFDRQLSELSIAEPSVPEITEQPAAPLAAVPDAELAQPEAIEPPAEPAEPTPIEQAPVDAEPMLDEPARAVDSHTVIYRVFGSATSGSITYTTDGMGIAQANGEDLPWSSTEKIKDDGLNFYSVDAQNDGSGTISCSITVDGKQVASETSTGEYAIVSCSSS